MYTTLCVVYKFSQTVQSVCKYVNRPAMSYKVSNPCFTAKISRNGKVPSSNLHNDIFATRSCNWASDWTTATQCL